MYFKSVFDLYLKKYIKLNMYILYVSILIFSFLEYSAFYLKKQNIL